MPLKFKCSLTVLMSLLITSCGQNQNLSSNVVTVEVPAQPQIEAYQERLKHLRSQVQKVKDGNDIKRLQRIFGYYFDEGLWDEMADLFADDASLEYARDGVYNGKSRIREYFYAMGDGQSGLKKGQLNEHFQLMPVITLSEDGLSAEGRWRDISLQGKYGEYAWWGEGPYENDYVKENGVWKIKKMQWFQTVVANYETGWAKHEDANQGVYVSQTLAPDEPPSNEFGSWPKTFLPPFHFDNPVGIYRTDLPENSEENVQ